MKTCWRIILIAVLAAVPLTAQENIRFYGEKNGYDEQVLPNYLMLSDKRLLIDLAGEWQATLDGKARTVKVPSNHDFEGRVIYRRTFTAGPEFRGRHIRLMALGINYRADIRINGEFIGNQNGGYVQTRYDLNEGLIKIDEPNTIEIIVDSDLDVRTTIPKRSTIIQPRFYGGIFREIFLLAIPQTALESHRVDFVVSSDLKRCEFTLNLRVRNYGFGYERKDTTSSRAVLGKKTKLRYVVELYNEEDPEPVYTNRYKKYRFSWEAPKIRELNDENIIEFDHYTSVEARFTLEKPTYWHMDNPYRYRLVVSLYDDNELIDQVRSLVGLTRIEVSEQYILVNNRPLPVKGVVYYEDYPGSGNTLPLAVMEDDILRIKKLGVNVIYFKHHPPHPYFMELCNRYGLMLFIEVPISILTARTFSDQAYLEDLRNYCKILVESDRSNVSILAWGLGAGSDQEQKEAETFVNRVLSSIRSVDSRPIFCNLIVGGKNTRLENIDIINLDIRTNNLITAAGLISKAVSQYADKPILAIYGAQIFSNNQNGYADPMSTKFQAKFITDVYKKMPEWKLTGGFIRSYNDFRLNRSHIFANPNSDPTVLTTGLVGYDRKERLAFDFVKAIYTDDRTDAVVMGTYEIVYPKTYPVVGLILVVIFVSFYRQSDKFKSSVFRSITKVYNFYTDIRDNRVITLWPALVVGVVSSMALAMVVSMLLFELKRNHVFDEFLASIVLSSSTKAWLDQMAWRPEVCVTMFSLWFFFAYVLISGLIKAFSYAFQSQVSVQQSIIGGFWSGSHYLFLIPVVILFHRLLKFDFFLSLTVLLSVVMVAWHFVRWFRIVKIMYDTNWWKVAAILGGLTLVLAFSVSLYYSYYFDFYGTVQYIEKLYDSRNYSFE